MMKKTIFFIKLLIIIFAYQSCNNPEIKELSGSWYSISTDQNIPSIWQITFKDDKLYIMDDYSFVDIYDFEISDNNLALKHSKPKLDTVLEIVSFNSDSIKLGNTPFKKYKGNFYLDQIDYPLIGIETNQTLQSFDTNMLAIHLSKSPKEGLKIRIGDKYYKKEQISFFTTTNRTYDKYVIFISENISLREIKELQYLLFSLQIKRLTYVLNKSNLKTYHIFDDKIEIWYDDYLNYLKKMNMPPPPPPLSLPYGMNSREEFLESGGALLMIKTLEDTIKLNEIGLKNKFIILIDPEIPLSDYVNIKHIVFKARNGINKKIISEIGTE